MDNNKRLDNATLDKISYLSLSIIIAIAVAARFIGIGHRSIWYDEGVTLGVLRLPFIEHLRHAWDHELNNQLIYYFLMRPWHALGEAASTVRSFSAIFSVGSVALVYCLGRRLFGNKAGLIAALILALHSSAIRYAQEARSYSLTIFLVLLSSLFLARFIDGGKYRDLTGWIIASIISFYSHFFAVLIFEAQIVSLAALGITGLRQRKALIIASCIALVSYSPVVYYTMNVPKQFISWIPELSFSSFYEILLFLAGGSLVLLLAYGTSFLFLINNILRGDVTKMRRWNILLIITWAILPLVTLSVISFRQPILLDRYVIFSVPAWALSAGAVLGSNLNHNRISMPVVFATLGVIVMFQFGTIVAVYYDAYEDWRTPAFDVASATLPGDIIIYRSPWAGLAFEYYLNKNAQRPASLQSGQLLLPKAIDFSTIAKNERIWLVFSRNTSMDDTKMITSYLQQSHPVISYKEYIGARIVVVLFDIQRRNR
jgi:mannosyltransferase